VQVLIYLSGVTIAAIVGFVCLQTIKKKESHVSLNQFNGFTYGNKTTALVFLVACLAFIGLPFTPTFIGIDLLFSRIGKNEAYLIFLTALSFVFIEIAVLRIYARIFFGQHMKGDHPVAFRYS
jgi:NADH:ubiquinone oxidoreductase subunit 4 (subunit M)